MAISFRMTILFDEIGRIGKSTPPHKCIINDPIYKTLSGLYYTCNI